MTLDTTVPYSRLLAIEPLLKKNSFFLFGPRGTGKSTLIKQQLKPKAHYDLLSPAEMTRLLTNPSLLWEDLHSLPKGSLVVIDEIQKIPQLLDVVHQLIEEPRLRFLLTGSSARKIKREAGVNLLAGRAWEARLFPLCYPEIPDFDLTRYLNRGGLPRALLTDDYKEEHKAYVATYLKEEVLAEALVRKLDSFARFLEVAALVSGEELNIEGIASDARVNATSVSNYIEILEDTLIAFRLPAFWKTKKRKAITRSKFFLFDVAIAGHLAKRGPVEAGSIEFGKAFEHFIINEVRAYCSYRRKDHELCYWRSTSNQEVDLVIGREVAIEIKSTTNATPRHALGLKALGEEKLIRRLMIVSRDPRERVMEGIAVLPWKEFLKRLWADELI